jgi:hypothetical protein
MARTGVAVCLLLLGLPAVARGQAATVRVYDYAGTFDERAQTTAARLLAEAKIDVTWVHCLATPASCAERPEPMKVIGVRIVRGPSANKGWGGHAEPGSTLATVYADAIPRTVRVRNAGAKLPHTARGFMKPNWSAGDMLALLR